MSFSAVGVRSEIVPENALSLERSFYLLQRNGNLNMGSLEKVNSKIIKKKYKLLQTRVFFVFSKHVHCTFNIRYGFGIQNTK